MADETTPRSLREWRYERDWNKVLTAAKERDKAALQRMFESSLYPWREDGRIGITASGEVEGNRIGKADFEADEVIQDKAELKDRAIRQFDPWLKEEKDTFRQAFGDWNPDEVNLDPPEIDHDYTEMRRVFRTAFINGYQEAIEKARREQEQLSPKHAATHASVKIINVQDTRTTRIYEIELSDPQHASGAVCFEVELAGDGQTELREVDTYD